MSSLVFFLLSLSLHLSFCLSFISLGNSFDFFFIPMKYLQQFVQCTVFSDNIPALLLHKQKKEK